MATAHPSSVARSYSPEIRSPRRDEGHRSPHSRTPGLTAAGDDTRPAGSIPDSTVLNQFPFKPDRPTGNAAEIAGSRPSTSKRHESDHETVNPDRDDDAIGMPRTRFALFAGSFWSWPAGGRPAAFFAPSFSSRFSQGSSATSSGFGIGMTVSHPCSALAGRRL